MRKAVRRNLVWGSLLTAIALAGCRRPAQITPGPSAEDPSVDATPALSQAPEAKASASVETRRAPGKEPQLELLEPGAEPRHRLRYVFEKGQSDQLEMKQKMTISMRVGSQVMPKTPTPETTVTMKLEVTNLENEIATMGFSVTDVKLATSPGLPAEGDVGVGHLLEDLKTYKGTQRVDGRGILISINQDTSGIKNPQVAQMMSSMEQTMSQMMAPLPQEPVGKGAKWRTVTHANQFGLKLVRTSTVEVVSIDDKGVDLSMVVAQSAPPSRISAPGLPAGVTVDLLGMDSAGTAEMRIDFHRLAPTAEVQIGVKMKMKLPEASGLDAAGEQIMDMTIDMDMNLTRT